MPTTPPADPTGPLAADDDWPALWSVLQQAGAGREPATADLQWQPDGWQAGSHWSSASRAWFDVYKPLLDAARTGGRCIVGQLGQSLDGHVATASGDSYFVTGAHSLLHLHRLRALCDAVLVGAGTVATDDPQLTTRRVPGAQPTRVVLDPTGRLQGDARVLRDGQAPSLWLCDARHRETLRSRLAPGATAEVLGIDGLVDGDGVAAPGRVVEVLASRGLRRVLVEGGGITVSRFVAAGALDRLHLVIAPVLIGHGRPGLQLPAQGAMRDCPRPPARVLPLGEDMLWDLDLRALGPLSR